MKRYQFIEYILHPESLNEQSFTDLKGVVEEYPFFQAARMLWIKNLHLLDHISLNNELKIAAAHISSREKLYFLLNGIVNEGIENEGIVNEKIVNEGIENEGIENGGKDNSILLDYERGSTGYNLMTLPEKEKQSDKDEKMNLIDNFLQKHNIEKIKVDSDNSKNEDFSVNSSQENEDLMSETLANIYIKQKHFLKALNIFEKLILKYPEKSIYFAARIKETENLINNLK